jgi:hypothetical protein
MPRNYELDTAAAKDANSGGKRITEPGLYVGKFRAAWGETNRNGTESVALMFVSDAGQEAGPLQLYTHNGDGEALPSYKMLNAIMACMGVKALALKEGVVRLYDFDRKADVDHHKETYPALVGPKIGLVLQGEEYEANDGKIKTRLVIGAAFEAEHRRMANEVIAKSPEATALNGYLTWFESHKVKPLKGGSRPAARANNGAYDRHRAEEYDDIPL